MLLELVIAITLGILAGTITGLIPGIHINLIGAILVSLHLFFLQYTSPIILVIFIVAMALTHSFIDFIPSIFLGAPDEDTVLSILPGHELLKKGRGYEAVVLTAYGSIIAIFIILAISPIFIFILPKFEPILKRIIPYLLIASSIFLISKENEKIPAVIVFLLSGFLGLATLNSNVNQPFLPMLSGLFGASSLIISIKTKVKIEKQIIEKPKINFKELIPPMIASAVTAPLTSFLPGLGSGQAAILGTSLIKSTKRGFLILLGATNTIVLGLSFIVLYSIGRKRTGMAVVVESLLSELTQKDVLIILITIVLTGIIAYYWTLILAKQVAKHINKFNYTFISYIILIILSSIVFIFSGFFGLFILIISTAMGLFGILTGVRRINLMGCLVIPVILIYLI